MITFFLKKIKTFEHPISGNYDSKSISFPVTTPLIFFNSLSFSRVSEPTFVILRHSPNAYITNWKGEKIHSQIVPIVSSLNQSNIEALLGGSSFVSEISFEIHFLIDVPSLGVSTYFLHELSPMDQNLPQETHFSNITIYQHNGPEIESFSTSIGINSLKLKRFSTEPNIVLGNFFLSF